MEGERRATGERDERVILSPPLPSFQISNPITPSLLLRKRPASVDVVVDLISINLGVEEANESGNVSQGVVVPIPTFDIKLPVILNEPVN